MAKTIGEMEAAKDLKTVRTAFSLFSAEMKLLIKTFGFGDVGPIYEMHCQKAFEGQGAIWFQDNQLTKNPYYGAKLDGGEYRLGCTDRRELILSPPLVIPYTAALATGTRAVVYVELPRMAEGVEVTFQSVKGAIQNAIKNGDVDSIRKAFTEFSNVLKRSDKQPRTDYAKRLWKHYADMLRDQALAGQSVSLIKDAEKLFETLEAMMNETRQRFAPPDQPTFEGREIVLGPRAGDYYLVKHGLEEGEMVVSQGAFKFDAEIQIQAKPSMMTPEGGGGGHDHGGDQQKSKGGKHAGQKKSPPPAEFVAQINVLRKAYVETAKAVKQRPPDLKQINEAFRKVGEALREVNEKLLKGHEKMLWKEFNMLLGNDAVEGREVKRMKDANRVYVSLKNNMRRMREKLNVRTKRIETPPAFQAQLAKIWIAYQPIQKALAADDLLQAKKLLAVLKSALVAVSDASLSPAAQRTWKKEHAKMDKTVGEMEAAKDLKTFRTAFSSLSNEMGELVKTFGFGHAGPIYELFCSMAFENRGAIWFQSNDQIANPYEGSRMPDCAQWVKMIAPLEKINKERKTHHGRKHH